MAALGETDSAPASWIPSTPGLASTGTWGGNQQRENLLSSFCLAKKQNQMTFIPVHGILIFPDYDIRVFLTVLKRLSLFYKW